MKVLIHTAVAKKGERFRPFLFFVLLSVFFEFSIQSPNAFAFQREKIGAYSRVESHTFSEIMSIDGFINDFSGTLEVGRTALTHDLAEIGVSYGAWRVGRILRYDYDIVFSQDTAVLNQLIERGLPIDRDQNYFIDRN